MRLRHGHVEVDGDDYILDYARDREFISYQ